MISTRIRILISTFFLFLFVSCSTNMIQTVESGNPENCSKKLLIVSQRSDFKDSIVEKMTLDLNSDYCFMKRIDVAALNNESDQNYDAVVIINMMKWMKINETVKSYLSRARDKAKFVVLTTTGKKGRVAKIDEIDAISSASSTEKANQLADTMSAKVRVLFKL